MLTHLRHCPDCQAERDRLQAIGDVLAEETAEPSDYRPAFGRLMNRIEVHEANRASVADNRGSERWWLTGPALATAATVVLAVGIAVVLNPAIESPAPGDFTTLTQETALSNGGVRRIELMFEQDASSEQIRSALIRTGSSIVSGPDPDGTYVVDMTIPAETAPDAFFESVSALEGVREVALAAGADPR